MQDKILSNAQQGKESSILVLQMRDNNLSRQIGHVYGSRKAAVRIYLILVRLDIRMLNLCEES